MNIPPTISIITPTFNAVNTITATIHSIQTQTFQNWELCITDDCSTDTTMDTLRAAAKKDHRIRIFQLKKNIGAAVARNYSIEQARGRYIAFLDADDLWEPEKLKKQLSFMQHNNYAFTYTEYIAVDDTGKNLHKELIFPARVSYTELLKTCSIGCLTVMIDRNAFSDITMPLIRRGQDYALWLKLLKQVQYAYCLPEKLARYRISENSLSRNKFKKMKGQWHIYRKIENLPLLRSLYNLFFYAYFGYKKNR